MRPLEWFSEKMEESRPPLKLKNNGGLLSYIFSKNHSKGLKMAIYCQLSKISTFSPFVGFRGKIAVLRHLEWFFEKMSESRPPLFFNFNEGLLSSIFSKNPSKCLESAIFPLKLQKLLKVDIF